MKKITILTAVFFASFLSAHAFTVFFSGNLVDETGLAYSKNYDIDLASNDIGSLSAQAIYSSATIAAATFNDGRISTGSITVVSLTALTTAYATDTITITTLTGLAGASVAIPGHIFTEGRDWRKGTTTTTAAKSLSDAMAAKAVIVTSTYSTNAVTLTAAQTGSYYNAVTVSCSNSAVSVAYPHLTGGQDNATVQISGTVLTANRNWSTVGNAVTAANSIATAINANTYLTSYITATSTTGTAGKILLASKAVGADKDFDLISSTPAAMSVSSDVMTGGIDSGCAAHGTNIYSLAHGLTVGLPVLYTGTPAILGLTTGTTYYVGVIDEDNISLSTTSAESVAGEYITVTCAAAPTTTDTYTLSPLAPTGTAGLVWSASNDDENWTALSVSSVSIAMSTYTVASSYLWDLGTLNYKYVRMAVKGPDTGGLKLKVVVNSKH